MTSAVIPYTVTTIGNYAFNGCSQLVTLDFNYYTKPGKIPTVTHNLTSIGNYAFDGCSNLVGDVDIELPANPKYGTEPVITYNGLIIPYSVQTIGDYAFRNCTSIPSLKFETGRGITNDLTSIGQYAFYGCTFITGNLALSSTKLTSIGSYAFYGCRFVNEVINPGSVKPIITGGTLSLPNTLTSIGDYAFYETGFKTANFPESLEEIGQSAFEGCARLTAVDLAKTNINTIGYEAFKNCTKISSLLLPVNDSYTTIRDNTFEGCSSIKEVIFPNNVTSINSYSFYGCTALERVVLPNALSTGSYGVGNLAFGACPNIKEVYATEIPTGDPNDFVYRVLTSFQKSAYESYQQESGSFTVNTIDNGNAVLIYPVGAGSYYTHTHTSGFDNDWQVQFPLMYEGLYSGQCGENAYYTGVDVSEYSYETSSWYESSKLIISGYGDMYNYTAENPAPWRNTLYADTLIINDNITSIGDYAFESNSPIKIVMGASDVTYVGEKSFYYNTQLQSISVADNVHIGDNAFYSCRNMSYDDFIANASHIGDYAFYNCDNLILDTELNLKNATYIGARAFYDCAGFTGGLKIGKATTIGEYAFYQVNFTGDLVIPESVTSLGAYAFYGCDNFNGTLALPETLETINNYTFNGCSGLTGELVIPNSIISINDRAFSGCSGFTGTLVIPENVTTIGSNAFSNCYGFTALELNDNITTIGSSAFHYCNGMTGELVLPNKLANINNSAFNSVPFTDVVTFRTQPATLGTSVFNAITGNVYVPYQYKDTYLNATNWSAYSAKTVGMPTYVELSGGVKYWNGISSGIEPLATDRVALDATLDIEDGNVLTIESFGYCGLDDETFGHLTVKDGGQLFHNKAYNDATLEKEIIGYAGQQSTDNGQQTSWYTISSPLNEEIDLSTPNSSFITPNSDYDLYRYDEPTYTWQNSKPGDGSTNFQNIEPGRGYLFASAEDATLQFNGHLNTDAVTYNLTAQGEKLTGFHLIGNPFAHDIYFDESIKTPEYQAVVFELFTNSYSGWRDTHLLIQFSDETPDKTMKVESAEISDGYYYTETLFVNEGVEITVSITYGKEESPSEHSFIIRYGDGEIINDTYSAPGSLGTEFNFDESYTVPLTTFTVKQNEQAVVNGYYVLTGEGAWAAEASTTEAIKPGQGILVKSLVDNYELAISNELSAVSRQQSAVSGQRSESVSMLALSVNNGKHSDRAFVVFNEGAGLDKINHENENIPLLYIPMEDADYAIAMMDENVNEIPVNFETNVMGQYTISLRQENCNLEGIYLLDKETGNKVNILEEDYTFMAMSGDNAERFVLAKDNGQQATDNGHFAYVNNGDIVIFDIEGDAKIRIIDALGRCLYNGEAADETNRISANVFANGVYVIEKTDDKGINVQKIIL